MPALFTRRWTPPVIFKASATALQTLTNKVGTGNLDTQAQNCVDAINEVLSKIPAGGSVLAEDVVFDTTGTDLTSTNVEGVIKEVYDAIPTTEKQHGTLTAGQTSITLTFTEQTIGTTTFVDWYVSDPTVNPTAITTTDSTVVLTFDAQSTDLSVGVTVEN